jgi:hypothetical protein
MGRPQGDRGTLRVSYLPTEIPAESWLAGLCAEGQELSSTSF